MGAIVGLFRPAYRSYVNNGLLHLFLTLNPVRLNEARGASNQNISKMSAESDFDLKFGIETIKRNAVAELAEIQSSNWQHGRDYQASAETSFRSAINHLPIRHEDFTLIDIGSGKGKAVILASNWNFKKIIGVEYSRHLHQVAVKNVQAYSKIVQVSADISLICGDACTFDFPPVPLVVYLYNPFGEHVMKIVIANLRTWLHKNKSKPLYIVYHNPVHADIWLSNGFVQIADLEKYNTLIFKPQR